MEQILNKLSDQIGKISIKSIIDAPAKYLITILFLGLIAAIFKVDSWIVIVFFCFAGVLLLLVFIGYIYFAVKKPDYLRSEDYNLKQRSLEILGDKDNILPIDASHIVNVANPHTRKIEQKGEDDE